jgi:ABC-type multidrug transport system fused ATPase/permease subunit
LRVRERFQREAERQRAWKALSKEQRTDYRRAFFLGRPAKDAETARAVVDAARRMPTWYWAYTTLAAAALSLYAVIKGEWPYFVALVVVFVGSAFFWWTRGRVLSANLPIAQGPGTGVDDS